MILSILPYSRVYFRKNVDDAINGFGLIWTKNHTYLAILCVFRKFVKNEAFFGRSALLKGLILTTKLPYSRVWFYAASSARVCIQSRSQFRATLVLMGSHATISIQIPDLYAWFDRLNCFTSTHVTLKFLSAVFIS